MNELSVRWVAERSWAYRTTFETPEGQPDSRSDLVFKGLDTFATVKLNGKVILEADNMFLEYRVNVTEFLKAPGEQNELEITFESALLTGRKLVKQHEHEHRFIAHQTEQSRLPVRKAQYAWGWDWGPILTTAGIWKPVFLETYVVRVDDVWMDYEVKDDMSTVEGTLSARVVSIRGGHARKVAFDMSLNGASCYQEETTVNEDGIAKLTFSIKSASLWYPHGYGGQPLYSIRATAVGDESRASKNKTVAFRKVELVREKDDYGKSFYFRINNIDVFCGGSNWIPGDSFLPSIDPGRYQRWLHLMLEGNQIMTRVWGGGIYEHDAFYDICDELGILVWQDFCMACASYPTYKGFLKEIEKEARYQLQRLRNHPSLVIWAGNNEDYQIQERYNLDYDYDGDKDPESWLKGTFPARYIYEYLLPKVVKEEIPGAAYHPSSPWGDGKKSFDPTVGDIHQWNVWHGLMRRYQEYPLIGGRFVSEFGMEAYPHLETIRAAITDPSQQHPGSAVMDYHNRAIDHEKRLMTYVVENFKLKYDLASFAHLTQIVQADAMEAAYRGWRRQWNKAGQRQCAGVLTWQLNDCWPTMSWAVVDYWLVKKPAFYTIARALKPLAVGVSRPFHAWTIGHSDPTIAMTDKRYDVWVASSLLESQRVDVEVRFYSIKTGKEVAERVVHQDVEAKANATTEICKKMEAQVKVPEVAHEPVVDDDKSTWVENQAGYFKYPARHKDSKPFDLAAYDPFVIFVRLTDAGSDGCSALSEDTVWPQPIKYLDFSDRGVGVSLKEGEQEVVVQASKPVKGFVFDEKRDWVVFSDNGFDIMPGVDKVIKLSGVRVQKLEELNWRWIESDV
jgi:beta-mannosidase